MRAKVDPIVILHIISIAALCTRLVSRGGLSDTDYSIWILSEVGIFVVWCVMQRARGDVGGGGGGTTIIGNDKKLRVLSWNMMAWEPTDDHRNLLYGTKVGVGRFQQIIDILVSIMDGEEGTNAPDIVLFQEVRIDNDGVGMGMRESLNTFMSERGYDGVVHKMNKKRTNKIGNATFWLRDRLNTVVARDDEEGTTLYNASVECILQWGPWCDYNHSPSVQPTYIYVINVHLKAGLRTHGGERLAQLHRCLARATKKENPCDFCIVGGDFNDDLVERDGGTAEASLLPPVLQQHGFHGLPVTNATTTDDSVDTCCVYGHRWWSFDHVLVAPLSSTRTDGQHRVRVTREVIISPFSSPRPSRIPSATYPSDHFPVLATLSLNGS